MNVRLSFLLVAVLLIFGGTFLVFQFTRAEEPPPKQPWLFKVDDDSIVRIEVSHAGETVSYSKRPGGYNWFIQDEGVETPVFTDKWSGTTLLLSGPQVNRVLAQTVDNPGTYGFDPPQTVVKVTERTGLSYEFHLGDPTPDGRNQYARLVGDPQLFTVPQVWAYVVSRLATEPPYPRLYYVEADNTVVHVGVAHNGRYVDYGRQTPEGDWVAILDDESEAAVPLERWNEVLAQVTTAPVAQVVSDRIGEPRDYGLSPPPTRVRVSTSRAEPVDFYLGDATPDGEHRYAQLRAGHRLFAVPESWAQMLEGLVTDPIYTGEPVAVSPEEIPEEGFPDELFEPDY